MTTIPVSALIAFVVALCLTPVVHALALRLGAVDTAGALRRKLHAEDIPRLGGVAIILAFYAPLVGLLMVESGIGRRFLHDPLLAYGMLGGGLAIAVLGIVDDVRGVSAARKLLVQVCVAIAVVALGFKIRFIALPSLPVIDGALVYPLSVLWIVGLTNAVNLIDGLDGLAAGLAALGLIPVIVVAIATGNLVLALICCTLAGSVLGFLVFNFHPARIFMGDSGSMFLGFILSLVTVQGSVKGPLLVSFLAPVLALGLPIMDTLLAITRRALLGQPLFAGDDGHIHHRLRQSGLSHRGTVLTMYGIALLLAVGSLCILMYRTKAIGVTLGGTALLCGVLMRRIGYLPLREVRGILRRTAEIRGRNRDRYARLRTLVDQLHNARDMQEVVRFSEELGKLVGARGGSLRLARSAGASWSWGDAARDTAEPIRFPIRPPNGADVGELQIIVDGPDALDAGSVGVAEHGCVAIARALGRCQDRVTHPVLQPAAQTADVSTS